MIRKTIILFTMLAVIIGSVGMPVNVHSCTMAGEEVAAPTCGMCGAEHTTAAATRHERKPCCNNHTELRQTDEASGVQPGFSLPRPLSICILIHTILAPLDATSAEEIPVRFRSHSPPPDLLKDQTYLFNASFLI